MSSGDSVYAGSSTGVGFGGGGGPYCARNIGPLVVVKMFVETSSWLLLKAFDTKDAWSIESTSNFICCDKIHKV